MTRSNDSTLRLCLGCAGDYETPANEPLSLNDRCPACHQAALAKVAELMRALERLPLAYVRQVKMRCEILIKGEVA